MVSDVKRAKQPVEAQLLQIILRDLDKFGFDLNLFGSGNVRLFH